MDTFLQDLRVTFRGLRKAPAFSLAAIATLALGIGATTAIFSTLNAVLLQPLPYPNPHDLYSVRTTLLDGRVTTGLLSGGEVARLNDPRRLPIVRAAAFQPGDLTLLSADGPPRHITVYGVTEGFFELFGLPMTKGGFAPGDFTPLAAPAPNAPPAAQVPPGVVISVTLWKSMYGADQNIIGKSMHFAELTATIVGVAPADFDTPHGADLWFAQRIPANDVNHGQDGFIRVKPGTSLPQATSAMAGVMAGLAQEFPQADRGRAYVVRPLVASIVGDLGPILVIVMSATGLLLLLACVNVTNLLLARGAARAREMAVRVALGAGRARLVRQMLTESVVLACVGAVVGVLVADLSVRGLMLHGASHLPRLDAVRFDGRVLLFAVGALVISGLCVGLAPALRVARTDVRTLMNESSRSSTGGRSTTRWLGALTVAEVALAIMLVAGAGWLVRTFAALHDTEAGFVTDRRLIFDVSFQGQRYPDGNALRAATTGMMDAVRALPGVTAVGATSNFPMRGTLEGSLLVRLHGEGWDPSTARGTRERFVSPGLFSAMGTRIVSGRDFGPQDGQTTQPTAIINRAFATLHFPGRNPLGAQFSAGYPEPDPKQEVTVVGVVDDVRERSLSDKAEPAFYVPLSQTPLRRLTMVVATSLPVVTTLESAIRDAVRQRDPQMAVDFDAASDVVAATIRRQQLGMTLMLIFGGIAVLLSAVGIYGVVAYAAVQRRDEMATRLALGASPTRVFWLVMMQGGALACVGAAIGIAGAYLSGRLVSSQIYAVRASDPLMLGAAIGIVVGIMVVATMIPAWRASRLSPSHVLRLG